MLLLFRQLLRIFWNFKLEEVKTVVKETCTVSQLLLYSLIDMLLLFDYLRFNIYRVKVTTEEIVETQINVVSLFLLDKLLYIAY